ncbi:MAG TPA: membrane protein insertase YidC [Candidatus Acidoferrales bacterium]|nr:membrane protein insertase YidC [Candidatus Acidoferrales bacterium]
MSDTTRGIVFVVAVVVITLVWMRFFQPPAPPPQKTAPPVAQTSPAPIPGSGVAAASAASAAPAKPVSVPAAQASSEKMIVVESALYRVQLSNRGGVVLSWKLNKYFDDQTPPRPLDLVNADAAQELGWPLSLMFSDAQLEAQANSALYEVTPSGGTLTAPAEVAFHWSDGHLDITKKLKFAQDYQTSVEVSASLDGRPLAPGVAWRGGFGDKAVYKANQYVSVFYQQGDNLSLIQYKKLGVPGNQIQPFQQSGPMEFTGIEDQFFAAAFIPAGTDLSLWHWTQWHHFVADKQPASEPEAEIAVAPAAPGPLKMRVFVGPKDLALLGKVQPSLERLVNFGWFSAIGKPLLIALQWLHRYIPNWGWAIVVLTLVINLAVFPLKMKSWRSMQEMQKLAPEMRSIQDRYKKYSMTDPRRKKMQEEMAELYQKHGINPMAQLGGCLPMVVQMPIWYALWRVLMGAIELRHAPWIFWIHDLSAKDPFYVLPIGMAITMYLMTKMTPQSAAVDPAQQKMMSFMPLMFAAFFFTYASGLNLYMFTSNLVGVGQQWYLSRTRPLPSKSPFKKKKQ